MVCIVCVCGVIFLRVLYFPQMLWSILAVQQVRALFLSCSLSLSCSLPHAYTLCHTQILYLWNRVDLLSERAARRVRV